MTAVWSSQWCRTQETADLAFPGKRIDQPAFNSFFDTPENSSSQTRAARDVLAAWRGPGVLVVVTLDILPCLKEGDSYGATHELPHE